MLERTEVIKPIDSGGECDGDSLMHPPFNPEWPGPRDTALSFY